MATTDKDYPSSAQGPARGDTFTPDGADGHIYVDPLGRLPSTPGEAHERLERSEVRWPSSGQGSMGGESAESVESAAVKAGVSISIPFNTVEGYTTHANAGVRVELRRGGAAVSTIDAITNGAAWFFVDFDDRGKDILSGDTVRVTDLAGGTPVSVDCTLTGAVNVSSEKVSGSAPSGNTIDVYLKIPSTYYGDIPPGAVRRKTTASGGSYNASFAGFNIRNGDVAYIFSTNAAGHVVMNIARTGAAMAVYPQYDEVMGFYNPGVNLTVKAGTATKSVGTGVDGFFDAWFSHHDIAPGEKVLCNLGSDHSIIVADVASSADPVTDIVSGYTAPGRPVRVTMNVYRDPVVVETYSDAVGAFSVDLSGLYDITGMEVYNVAWYGDAGDCVVYEFFTYSWFLPEGYTGTGFDEWVLVMNPSAKMVRVRMTFQTLEEEVEGPLLEAMPGSRVTVHVNEWVPERHVSTMVTAIDGGRIMSERAMYMFGTVDGKWGAHDSIGIMVPNPVWYLPEGATYYGFDEWVLIQNPNNTPVKTRVQFLGRGGVVREFVTEIGAGRRYTVHVNEHVPDTEIATRVESLTVVGGEALPVFAERAMYMATLDGKRGAHDSIGLSTPAPEWYLPEGTTRPGFDEWVLVMNPNDAGTDVRATFLTPEGVGGTYDFHMEANSRFSIHVNDFVPDRDVSTVVASLDGTEILAERAMYMNTPDGKRGAHASIGSSRTDISWYLPEGTTRPGFDEWVLVQNPNDEAAEVRVVFLGPQGEANRIIFTMQPNSRFSVHVNEFVHDLDVSTVVESVGVNPVGVLAERAMYMWTADYKQGAHCSIGIPTF
ncbi:MAG: hypothetical protein QME88_10795 [Actinomycetota bacterium]|nr:hypothetical protein [Actinomycetota bacterium]